MKAKDFAANFDSHFDSEIVPRCREKNHSLETDLHIAYGLSLQDILRERGLSLDSMMPQFLDADRLDYVLGMALLQQPMQLFFEGLTPTYSQPQLIENRRPRVMLSDVIGFTDQGGEDSYTYRELDPSGDYGKDIARNAQVTRANIVAGAKNLPWRKKGADIPVSYELYEYWTMRWTMQMQGQIAYAIEKAFVDDILTLIAAQATALDGDDAFPIVPDRSDIDALHGMVKGDYRLNRIIGKEEAVRAYLNGAPTYTTTTDSNRNYLDTILGAEFPASSDLSIYDGGAAGKFSAATIGKFSAFDARVCAGYARRSGSNVSATYTDYQRQTKVIQNTFQAVVFTLGEVGQANYLVTVG